MAMGGRVENLNAQQSVDLPVSLVKYVIGSPAGMGQLIKFFETQSRQLDQQTIHTQPVCFNPEFESLIRFKGVPILPPAITSSRRDELQQYKKDAVLLEKRLKARYYHTQQVENSYKNNQADSPENIVRPTARQLNFDVDSHKESTGSSILQDRLAATNSLSTYAVCDPDIATEDFGLQTIDSASSEFTTLDENSIPKLFNGLVLTSFKEQKISYDLDRLSKALNVQELTSTSGSDMSDFVPGNKEDNFRHFETLSEKVLVPKELQTGDEHAVSFCNESQDTVVEVSPEAGDNTSTSGFVENAHLETTHSTPCSSPGYGSANTTATADSQRSNRSSPKSFKSAVHFSSFVIEYNTRASQEFAKPTVVTKKLTADDIPSGSGGTSDSVVMPIIGNPSESKHKHTFDFITANMLADVSLESDGIPFQMYNRSETHRSNKEGMKGGHTNHSLHVNKRKSEHCDNIQLHKPALQVSNISHHGDTETPGSSMNILSPEPNSTHSKSTSGSYSSHPFLSVAQTDKPNLSVSDSQGSNALTLTSGSSSSTIRNDIPKQKDNISSGKSKKICNAHLLTESRNTVTMSLTEEGETVADRTASVNNKSEAGVCKNANADQDSENGNTPQRTLTRRGSYTLSEPSPALLRVKSKLEDLKRKQEQVEQQRERKQQKESIIKAPSMKHNTSKVPSVVAKPADCTVPSHSEREGKAEHISKYLSQVQLQNSMNFSWETNHLAIDGDVSLSSMNTEDSKDMDTTVSVLEVIKSIAESQGGLDSMTGEDLISLHRQQMELKKQELMRQQQQDLEELFVQQRREVMLLEAELRAARQFDREQQDFLIQNAPENIKVKARNHDQEYSPEQSYDKPGNHVSKQPTNVKSQSVPSLHTKTVSSENIYSTRNKHGDNIQLSKKTELAKKGNKLISETAKGKVNKTPDFSPSQFSPSIHRPLVARSPLKQASSHLHDEAVFVPSHAYPPEMKVKFDKVSAVAKGFLTRCLFRSDKVQELIKTIQDTRAFAINFQTETPIKKGVFTSQDTALLERIINQLQAALLDIHEIFFEIPVSERMVLIEQTRIKENEKRIKASSDSSRESGPKISQATLKALERKRKAREAENIAILSTTVRPKTAPASTHNKLHNQTDFRVLKPLTSHAQISRPESSRSDKERPQTAPEKQLNKPKRITAPSIKPALSSSNFLDCNKDSSKEGVNNQGPVSSRGPVIKSKVAPSKPVPHQPTKSWR